MAFLIRHLSLPGLAKSNITKTGACDMPKNKLRFSRHEERIGKYNQQTGTGMESEWLWHRAALHGAGTKADKSPHIP